MLTSNESISALSKIQAFTHDLSDYASQKQDKTLSWIANELDALLAEFMGDLHLTEIAKKRRI